MSPLERQTISEKIRAMTTEEQKCVARQIPNKILQDELSRRWIAADNKITAIMNIVEKAGNMEGTLTAMTDFIRAIREVV